MGIVKVLIADDEPMIREGLSEVIMGFNLPLTIVGEAKNGLEALKLAKTLVPDIIITDICMPKLSGLDFIKELKESVQNIKVIIISGFNEFEYAREAIRLGVSAYLLKPIQEGELKQTLLKCMNMKEGYHGEKESYGDSLVDQCLKTLKEEFTDRNLDLTLMSQKIAVNADYLSRKLKNETGLSFKEWITKLRIQKSLDLLKSKQYTICEVAEMVGYSNQHYFSTAFKNYMGYSPKHYQEMGYEKL